MWGTPIPVFYAKDTGVEIVNKDIIDHLCGLLETEGSMDIWWKKTVAELVPQHIWAKHNINPENVVKGEVIRIYLKKKRKKLLLKAFLFAGYFRHLV